MNNFYRVQFIADIPNLLEIAQNFSVYAEISEYTKNENKIVLVLATQATGADIEKMCDDFKIEIESNYDVRLTYKVLTVRL